MMAKRYSFQPNTSDIPTSPGVYRYFDENKTVIYVGKAKNLRNRLTSYFVSPHNLHPRTKKMLETAKSLEWTVVKSDLEALQLEYSWIKAYAPKFNVEFRDDKTYVSLAVTVKEEFPRIFMYRGPKKNGVKYFGPYVHAYEVRKSLDQLLKIYPIRSCSKGVFNRHNKLGRPCLLGYIEKCSAPCIGKISPEDHRQNVNKIISFLKGNATELLSELKNEMLLASENLDFESAAKLRDKLTSLTGLLEKQTVVLDSNVDADFFGFFVDEIFNASAQIFRVRNGRIQGQEAVVFSRDLIETEGSVSITSEEIENFILQHYTGLLEQESTLKSDREEKKLVPKQILVSNPVKDSMVLAESLAAISGVLPKISVPKLGAKKELMDTVVKNSAQTLLRFKTAKANDIVSRNDSLQELAEYLDLQNIPIDMECTDISHLSGTNVVGSIVKFIDALPKKNLYRHYNIKYAAGEGYSNDVASIKEIVFRRFTRDNLELPNLFIVDGGAPQVNAASSMLKELNIEGVDLIGLAKRMEEIWLPNNPHPVILPRNSEALFLIQRIRDEAHNFAIRHQRSKRGKELVDSELDRVPGLGKEKRKQLLLTFSSIDKIRKATAEELQTVPGIGKALAANIISTLDDKV